MICKKRGQKVDFSVLYNYKIEIYIESEIPIGAGMGSSAAYSLALSAAFFKILGHILNYDKFTREDVLSGAFLLEVEFHGRTSGCDA